MKRQNPVAAQQDRGKAERMRITFAAIPAHGHVLPLVPLALAAARAGHAVTFAAGEEFRGRLPVPVVQSVPAGMTLHDAEREARGEIRDPHDPLAWPTALFGIVMPRQTRPRLLAHWAEHGPPDLVIYEGSNLGAACAAAEIGVRSVPFHVSLAPPEFFLGRLASVTEVNLSGPADRPHPCPMARARPGRAAPHPDPLGCMVRRGTG